MHLTFYSSLVLLLLLKHATATLTYGQSPPQCLTYSQALNALRNKSSILPVPVTSLAFNGSDTCAAEKCIFFSKGQQVSEEIYLRDAAATQQRVDRAFEAHSQISLVVQSAEDKANSPLAGKDARVLLNVWSSRGCDETLLETITVDGMCYSTPGASSMKVTRLPEACWVYVFADGDCRGQRRLASFGRQEDGERALCLNLEPFEGVGVVCDEDE